MWNKLAKIGLEAGKAYIANRGVDGAIEDAQKVFGWAKKGANSLFSSNEELEDGLPGLDFDVVQEITDDCIHEIDRYFREAKRYEITSNEFCQNASIALYTGYNAIAEMVGLEDEVDDDDYNNLLENYVNQIDDYCDTILMYVGQECTGRMNTPKDTQIGDEDGPICMQVYGVLPVNFTYDFTMLVVLVTNGIVVPNTKILLPDQNETIAEIAFIRMFGKVIDGAGPGDVCCVALKGDYTDMLPNDEVFYIGDLPDKVSAENNIINESIDIKESELEYLQEYKACLEDDGEISSKERRLLDCLAKSLNISKDRAEELESSCSKCLLTPDEQEYANEVKACLENDGTISEREHRLLDRLAKSLGISTERAREIEHAIWIQK